MTTRSSQAPGRGIRWITLLTDFGVADAYVAAMKGVIATLAPRTPVADAAHDVPRGDIAAGAWVLSQYWNWWPPGTIHVAVVDPGVGTARAPLLAIADGRWLIAPDNGLLSGVASEASDFRAWRLKVITGDREISSTFHGRDVFAVAAARLARGDSWRRLAAERIEVRRLAEWREPERRPDGVVMGAIVHVDRFGNAITNLRPRDLPPGGWTLYAGRFCARRLHRTYGDVAKGRPLVYIGSSGRLELAVRDGSAAARFRLCRGGRVSVRPSRARATA